MNKPKHISPEKWTEIQTELRENINYFFIVAEIFDHAFTDFQSSMRKSGLGSYEYRQQMNKINHVMRWFRSWYNTAFKGNEELIDSFGETGDKLNEKLKELYLGATSYSESDNNNIKKRLNYDNKNNNSNN